MSNNHNNDNWTNVHHGQVKGANGDSVSRSSDSSSSSSQTGKQSSSNGTDEPLAARESQQVRRSKSMVYLALLLAALVVGVATFNFVKRGEEMHFEREFLVFTDRLVTSADHKALSTFRAVHNVAVAIQAEALNNHEQWPNVSNSYFERRTERSLEETGSELIAFAPIVLQDEAIAYDKYAVDHQAWIQEGLVQLGLDDVERSFCPNTTTTRGLLWTRAAVHVALKEIVNGDAIFHTGTIGIGPMHSRITSR